MPWLNTTTTASSTTYVTDFLLVQPKKQLSFMQRAIQWVSKWLSPHK